MATFDAPVPGGERSAFADGRLPAFWAPRHRRLALIALFAAVALVPWTVTLAQILPARHLAVHWDATWIGFDVGLLASLTLAAVAAWRRSPMLAPAAAVSATLLVCDAWFDVTTAAIGTDVAVSLATALLVELPLAATLLLGARALARSNRRPR